MLGKPDTALCKAGPEGVNVGESAVCCDLAQGRPEVFSWVEFRCVGRQEEKVEVVWHVQLGRAVPGSAVQNEQSDDILGQAGGEVIKMELHGGEVGTRQDKRVGGAAPGMHRSEDVTPLVLGTARRDRALTDRCPDPAIAGLQAKARLVLETEPHALFGLFLAQRCQHVKRFFERRLVLQRSPPRGVAGAAVASVGGHLQSWTYRSVD